MAFWVTYHQLTDLPNSDFQAHLGYAKELTKTTAVWRLLTGDDRLWHLGVKVLHWLDLPWNYAAAGVTAVAVMAVYGVFLCAAAARIARPASGDAPGGCAASLLGRTGMAAVV